ncbi:uncharacterized protein LOC132041868 [Lycium ferocissimum]|uniref:uncharacterized protein LOC132041868 n=1 Tax=Lycium ferocissimum TaxID=112874 RepID=UPI0028167143|nr:uncharacterized protein LOC132041868 [Lycium ferocissimum]
MGSLACLIESERLLAREVQNLANSLMRLDVSGSGRVLDCIKARSSLLEQIKARQFEDASLSKIHDKVLRQEAKEAVIDDEGILRIKGRVCVSRVDDSIKTILAEAHSSRYSIHPGATKMYRDLRQHYLLRESLDKVKVIQEKLLAAQSRQKEYADRKVRDLEFIVGEQVVLKVSPMKSVTRFGKKGKLSPRFIGQFEILNHVRDV